MNPKPLPFIIPKNPRNKPEQRERKHRMTLVTTLIGREGVAMFTDTQETIGGYAKKSVDKLTLWSVDGPFRFAIAAATNDTTYLEMLERQISGTLLGMDTYDLADIEKALADTLTDFYAKHIWPQSSKSSLIEFLITIQPMPNGRPEVIHISGTAVSIPSLSEHHKSIGVGAFLADYLVPIILGGGQTLAELAFAAVYIGKQVQDNVDGCGAVERITLLANDGEHYELYSDVIKEIETNLFPFGQVIEHAFIAVSNVTEQDDAEHDLSYIAAELQDVRHANSALWDRIQVQIKAHAQWREKWDKRSSAGPH
jgi:hypothetical protein